MKTNLYKSLVITVVFALGILVFAFEMNVTYNQTHLTKGDSAYYYYKTGTVLQVAKAFGIPKALSAITSWPSEETALYYLEATILSPILPVRTFTSVILNGIWYLLMAVCLCIFFWQKTKSLWLSVLLPVPMLIAGPPLADPYQGLADLHVNLLGYTIGVSIMCLMLISDHLRKPWPTFLAGFFTGLLLLGRVYAVALVGIAMAPYVLQGIFFASNTDRKKTLLGTGIIAGLCLLIGGWWLVQHRGVVFGTFERVQNVPGAAVGVGSLRDNTVVWLNVIENFFFYNAAYYPLTFL